MSYCVEADVTKAITEATVILLTDDANSGSIDSDNLDNAIAKADAIINSYCRGRYTTIPFASPDEIIKQISIDLTICFLYARRRDTDSVDIDEGMRERYKNAIALLKDIQKGILIIDEADSYANTGGMIQTNKSSTDKVYDDDLWSYY